MRKLLVASQKGGVGKTTTSMNLAAATARAGTRVLLLDADPLSNVSTALNLAEHPHRRPLRAAGVPLPGVLVPNVVPGLDVLSPYDDGRCSDADFDYLLQVLATPAARQCYGCMIVDVPPFLGANPGSLLGSCDEFLLVMRAEAMAYRTLPAFLELVQRSSRNGHALPMRGILLTLPEGEEPGCRWERELRGRFGSRVLPEVIPHDETIPKALGVGQIGSHVHPESPAACQYGQLVDKLGLPGDARPAAAAEQGIEVLRVATAAVRPAIVAAPAPVAIAADVEEEATKGVVEVDHFVPAPELEIVKPVAPSPQRGRRLTRSGEILRPVRTERATPSAAAPPPSTRIKASPVLAMPPTEPARPAPDVPQPSATNASGQLWPLWILLGAVLGGGVRFVPLSPALLPILVGLVVAFLVVVVLGIMARYAPQSAKSSDNSRGRPRLREPKKTAPRPEPRKDPAARLAALATGTAKNARRKPHAN